MNTGIVNKKLTSQYNNNNNGNNTVLSQHNIGMSQVSSMILANHNKEPVLQLMHISNDNKDEKEIIKSKSKEHSKHHRKDSLNSCSNSGRVYDDIIMPSKKKSHHNIGQQPFGTEFNDSHYSINKLSSRCSQTNLTSPSVKRYDASITPVVDMNLIIQKHNYFNNKRKLNLNTPSFTHISRSNSSHQLNVFNKGMMNNLFDDTTEQPFILENINKNKKLQGLELDKVNKGKMFIKNMMEGRKNIKQLEIDPQQYFLDGMKSMLNDCVNTESQQNEKFMDIFNKLCNKFNINNDN
jgi:hypothetical protein